MTTMKEHRTVSSSASARGAKGGAKTSGEDGDGQKSKGKKRIDIKSKKFLIILVAILGAGYFGYSKFLVTPPPPPPPSGDVVVKTDPMVLNLADGHYLKVEVDLQLLKGKAPTDIYTSKASELTINEFSNRDAASLQSTKQLTALKEDLLKKIKKAYPEDVFDIFISQFTIQ